MTSGAERGRAEPRRAAERDVSADGERRRFDAIDEPAKRARDHGRQATGRGLEALGDR